MTRQLDKSLIQRHFGENAATYDAVTPVQQSMGRELVGAVGDRWRGDDPKRILELGCGTGALTHTLTARFPTAHIVAIDLAP